MTNRKPTKKKPSRQEAITKSISKQTKVSKTGVRSLKQGGQIFRLRGRKSGTKDHD